MKDLETNFKLACCKWFASGGKMPWGHSEDTNEVISQRFYSIPDRCFDIYKAHQLSDYGTSDEKKSILLESLDHLKSVCAPCFDNLEHHAFNICAAFGKMLDKSCYFVQYGFQHGIYPCHMDTAGPLKPQLRDGDGFGQEIFTYQIRGPRAWVFVAGETDVPVNGKTRIGIKFEVRPGDAWGLSDKARYKCVHGVLPTMVKKEEHSGSCFSCRATFTVRNGCVTQSNIEKWEL